MERALQQYYDQALKEYTAGDYYQILLDAKNEYFAKVGPAREEDADYEARMNCFNDWYLLQYVAPDKTKTPIKDFLIRQKADQAVRTAFYEVNYSLFEYAGHNFSKQIVLQDILHGQKIALVSGHEHPGLVKGDIFIGRILNYGGKNNLMAGVCLLPREIRPMLQQHCKKIRQQRAADQEIPFLMKLELLKTKWKNYAHLPAQKFFKFS